MRLSLLFFATTFISSEAKWKEDKWEEGKWKEDHWKNTGRSSHPKESDPVSYHGEGSPTHHEGGHELDIGTDIYKQWRDGEGGGQELLRDNEDMILSVSKEIHPYVRYSNPLANANDCNIRETTSANERMVAVFNGLIESRGFRKPDWIQAIRKGSGSKYFTGFVDEEGGGRNLRAMSQEERELWCWCPECPGGWYCHMVCAPGYCRRRLSETEAVVDADDDPDNVTFGVETFEDLELLITDLKRQLQQDCEDLMGVVAETSGKICHKCRQAIAGSKCEIGFDYTGMVKVMMRN